MKKISRILLIVSFTVLLSLTLMVQPFAYLEPATVTYLYSIVAGAVIAAGVAIGVFRKKIRLFFRNLKIKMLEKKLSRQADKNNK